MNRGYTLIEILISLTILMMFMGAGVASFLTFNSKQQMSESAKGVQEMMRTAQIKAAAGALPAGCTRISAYRVNLTGGTNTVQLSAVCTNPNSVIPVASYTMIGNTRASISIQDDFVVLSGGVITSSSIVYLRTPAGSLPVFNYQFTVNKGGSITDGYFY